MALPVRVTDGQWFLAVAPQGGWRPAGFVLPAYALGFTLSLSLAVLAWRVLRQPALLQAEVRARTAELNRANQRLQEELGERQRAEQARAAAEEQLLQAQKMEAIGQLAGGVAHDFNNMLAGILGYGRLLREEAEPGSLAEEAAQAITEAGERAAALTRQLLGYARRGKFRVVPIDLHAAVGEVVRLLRRTLDDRIALTERLLARPSLVQGDPEQLQQVILNLAVNARDAMPRGGTLTFETAALELGPAEVAAHPGLAPGRYLSVSVADTGTGIAPEIQGRVFEPFFTTKEAGQGTGMGLAMVYGIAKNHGGWVELWSEVGRGSRFTVVLPAWAGELPARPTAPQPGERRPRSPARGRALVVDDEPLVRRVAARLLESLGYEAEEATSPADCLERYRARPFDVVLLDLAMPGMDGRACFLALRAADPRARVVLCSGYGRDGRAQEILDLGAAGFLQKPFDGAALVALLAPAPGGPGAV